MSVYHQDGTVTLHLGKALEVLGALPDQSVDCCVTSPPYYGLRSYLPEGHPDKIHEIGTEKSPAEFVERLRLLFAEVRRVLSNDGTLWLNLGDSYSAAGGHTDPGKTSALQGRKVQLMQGMATKGSDRPIKNLLGIPWRVAFALQDDGWILRSEIIWAKRNFMPEAVTDRPTSAHEQIFLFSKSRRYWYDADAIREESDPDQEAHNRRYAREYNVHTDRAATTGQPGNVNNIGVHSRPGKGGRNARDVWTISSIPFPGAHFAVFPPELPRRCIAAGCKPGGTVLDPFSGSGTTGMVAQKLGRKYVGIDLNPEYLDLSLRTRLADQAMEFPA